jgi:hypothetical protein
MARPAPRQIRLTQAPSPLDLCCAEFPRSQLGRISTIQFPNKFQYSNSKNQAENKSVCDLKFGSEIYLEIGL